MKRPSRKLILVALLAAIAGGFCLALGDFQAGPRASDYAAVARVTHAGTGSWLDHSLATLWQAGGDRALASARWAMTFALSTALLALLILGWGVGSVHLPRRWRIIGTSALFVGLGAVCVFSLAEAIGQWSSRRVDRRLVVPEDVFSRLPEGGVVYANPSAIVWAKMFAADRAGDFTDLGVSPADPAGWRAAAREADVVTAIFAGPASEYDPLLKHLLVSRDWRIDAITNAGFVLVRDGGPNALEPDVERLQLGSDYETAIYLAQLAGRLEAAERLAPARAALDRARDLAGDDPAVLLPLARFAARFGHWDDVREYAAKARRQGGPPAACWLWEGKALLEAGLPGPAREALENAVHADPDDTQALLLLATACRSGRDFGAEVETLERLVLAARRAGLPSGGYLAYLGQANAQLGNAREAAERYREALASGDLGPQEIEVVKESLAIIESRSPEAREKSEIEANRPSR